MTSPVRHSVELDAVGELHGFLCRVEALLLWSGLAIWKAFLGALLSFLFVRASGTQRLKFNDITGPCVRPQRRRWTVMRALDA